MNQIRLNSLYYGAFALQWLALLSSFSLGGWELLLGGGAVSGILLGVSLYTGSRGRYRHGNDMQANIFMIVALILSLLLWPVLGIEQGIFYLLAGLIVASNLALKTRRNLYFSFLATLFIVLYAASRSYSNAFTIWITLYVLAGVFTLMLAHTDARIDASMGYGDGRRQLSGFAVLLVTICLVLGTGLIYLLFPRLPPVQVSSFPSSGGTDYDDHSFSQANPNGPGKAAKAGAEGSGGGNKSGEDGKADDPHDRQPLDIRSGVATDNSLMFYLQADIPLYIRTKVYDHFDGTLWSYSNPQDIALYRPQRHFVFDGYQGEASGKTVYQHYVIQEYTGSILPTAARPVSINFPGNTLILDREGNITAIHPLRQGTGYTVKSYRQEVSGHIASGDGNRNFDTKRYLQIPPGVTERTAELAGEVTAGGENDLQRTIRIESYLRDTYPYSLTSVGQYPESGLVEWFLFENKKGHCELFASAMVMMLRQLGIPARFVTGYVATSPNPITGYQEVRNPGHAWVEAWIAPHGWITFEPTPNWSLAGSEKSPLLIVSLIHYLGEKVRLLEQEDRTDQDSLGFMRSLTVLLQIIWKVVQALVAALEAGWKWLIPWLPAVAARLVLVVSVTLGTWFILWPWFGGQLSLLRLRLSGNQTNRERVLFCWYEMERSFSRIGHPRRESETPDEYRRVIDIFVPGLQSQSDVMFSLFQQARYGNISLNDSDTTKVMHIAVQLIRATMHPSLPKWLLRIFHKSDS